MLGFLLQKQIGQTFWATTFCSVQINGSYLSVIRYEVSRAVSHTETMFDKFWQTKSFVFYCLSFVLSCSFVYYDLHRSLDDLAQSGEIHFICDLVTAVILRVRPFEHRRSAATINLSFFMFLQLLHLNRRHTILGTLASSDLTSYLGTCFHQNLVESKATS